MGCCMSDTSESEEVQDLKTNLVWERKDKRFKDVYSITEDVSQGSMGSVMQVRNHECRQHGQRTCMLSSSVCLISHLKH